MATNPKAVGDHLEAILEGWQELAPTVSFDGMSLAQFSLKVEPSLTARAAVAELERQLAAARVVRDNADLVSSPFAELVVNTVRGSSAYGEDSALYASFGYIRKSARKSGLHRKTVLLSLPSALKNAA